MKQKIIMITLSILVSLVIILTIGKIIVSVHFSEQVRKLFAQSETYQIKNLVIRNSPAYPTLCKDILNLF